jgi:hypothetical protein
LVTIFTVSPAFMFDWMFTGSGLTSVCEAHEAEIKDIVKNIAVNNFPVIL